MIFNDFEFHIYRNRLPPYYWNYLIIDDQKRYRYESIELFKTEREAIHAAFACMYDLIEQGIKKDNTLPQLN